MRERESVCVCVLCCVVLCTEREFKSSRERERERACVRFTCASCAPMGLGGIPLLRSLLSLTEMNCASLTVDRWKTQKASSYEYFVFSGPPRLCLGNQIGMQVMWRFLCICKV
jgi:succinate-acetate transporter protein